MGRQAVLAELVGSAALAHVHVVCHVPGATTAEGGQTPVTEDAAGTKLLMPTVATVCHWSLVVALETHGVKKAHVLLDDHLLRLDVGLGALLVAEGLHQREGGRKRGPAQ